MKNNVFTFLAVLATVFLFSQCTKDEDNAIHNTYFWTNVTNEKETLTLFVDGQVIGALPYFTTELTCSNDTLKQKALSMNLPSGKYHLEAKDSKGAIRSDCTLKVYDTGMGVGPGTDMNNPGSVAASMEGPGTSNEGSNNSCVIVNLFY